MDRERSSPSTRASPSPDEVVAALATLTFATGTRYLLADSVQSWKAGDLEPLERALADMPPDTVLVLIARGKAPQQRLKGGREGRAARCAATTRRSPGRCRSGWSSVRARRVCGSTPRRPRRWWPSIGTGQQRLAREIEKLAMAAHPAGTLSAAGDRGARPASDGRRSVYDLADALVDGVTARTALCDRRAAARARRARLEADVRRSPAACARSTSRRHSSSRACRRRRSRGLSADRRGPRRRCSPARRGRPRGCSSARSACSRTWRCELRGGGTGGFDEDTVFYAGARASGGVRPATRPLSARAPAELNAGAAASRRAPSCARRCSCAARGASRRGRSARRARGIRPRPASASPASTAASRRRK